MTDLQPANDLSDGILGMSKVGQEHARPPIDRLDDYTSLGSFEGQCLGKRVPPDLEKPFWPASADRFCTIQDAIFVRRSITNGLRPDDLHLQTF